MKKLLLQLENTHQNLANTANLPFYQDFIFVKNLNVVQQVARFTRKVLSEANSVKEIQL